MLDWDSTTVHTRTHTPVCVVYRSINFLSAMLFIWFYSTNTHIDAFASIVVYRRYFPWHRVRCQTIPNTHTHTRRHSHIYISLVYDTLRICAHSHICASHTAKRERREEERHNNTNTNEHIHMHTYIISMFRVCCFAFVGCAIRILILLRLHTIQSYRILVFFKLAPPNHSNAHYNLFFVLFYVNAKSDRIFVVFSLHTKKDWTPIVVRFEWRVIYTYEILCLFVCLLASCICCCCFLHFTSLLPVFHDQDDIILQPLNKWYLFECKLHSNTKQNKT